MNEKEINVSTIEMWCMILFVCQCVLFFLPESQPLWMRLFPSIFAVTVGIMIVIGLIGYFVICVISEYRIQKRKIKELTKIPEE
jgi:hypothetical protein